LSSAAATYRSIYERAAAAARWHARVRHLPGLPIESIHTEEHCRPATDAVDSGMIECQCYGQTYPIVRGLPRFVPASNYAQSFGFQWNRYAHLAPPE